MSGAKCFTRLNDFLADCPKSPLSDRDYKFLSQAETLSRKSELKQHKVGCVIAQRSEVLGSGYNSVKTHPFQARWNRYSSCLHAEMVALLESMRNQSFSPSKATIYVSRYTRQGTLGCSYPCVGCWSALDHVGVRQIVCYDESDVPTKIVLT